jgi:hypothetical protein
MLKQWGAPMWFLVLITIGVGIIASGTLFDIGAKLAVIIFR